MSGIRLLDDSGSLELLHEGTRTSSSSSSPSSFAASPSSPPPPSKRLWSHPLVAVGAATLVATALLATRLDGGSGLLSSNGTFRLDGAGGSHQDGLLPARPPNYYAQDGMLQILGTGERGTIKTGVRWLPLEILEDLAERGKTGLEVDLKLGDGFDLYQEYSAASEATKRHKDQKMNDESAPGGKEGGTATAAETAKNDKSPVVTLSDPRFDYLRGKTILLLGDSVDRFAIDFVCKFLDGKLSVRQFNRPPWAKTPPDLTKTSTDVLKDPHYCQLPPALGNASIWSWMTYGTIAEEDTFRIPLPNVWPRQIDTRLELLRETLDKFEIRPDIMLLHTALWELNTINLLDATANVPRKDRLDLKDVIKFKDNTKKLLEWANLHFPRTKKVYRTVHATKVTQGTWFLDYSPRGTKNISRVPYSLNKGEQLNAVIHEVAPQYGVELFDFRKALNGYTQDFEDSIHPGQVGKAIYTQMLLYFTKWL